MSQDINYINAPSAKEKFPNCAYALNIDTLLGHKLSLTTAMNNYECFLIIEALDRSLGNITQAAKLLGIGRTTLTMKLNKLKDHGIDHRAYRIKHGNPVHGF